MKCPIDKTEMEKGQLVEHGTGWRPKDKIGFLEKSLFGNRPVFAYKCPKCGKVELIIIEPEK
jgi:hypothetical protein